MAFYRQPNWAKTLQKVEPFGAFTRLFVRCKYVTGRAGRPQKLQIWAITKRQANSPKTWNAVNKSNYQILLFITRFNRKRPESKNVHWKEEMPKKWSFGQTIWMILGSTCPSVKFIMKIDHSHHNRCAWWWKMSTMLKLMHWLCGCESLRMQCEIIG